jgi:hypothetical protein
MKKQILYLLTVSLIIVFTACKKDSSSSNNDEMATHSDDQEQFDAELDAASNDVVGALESSASFTGRLQGTQGIAGLQGMDDCDATAVLDVVSNPRTITITFAGTCLGNRTRSGVIVISMAQGVQWKTAGAAVTVTFQNFKITRVADNKSVTINGSQTYTNVSGGLMINLPTLGTITHSITSSGLNVTFSNTAQRSWQVAKQRTFSWNANNSTGVITTTGTHTEGNVTNVAEWGTNRFGRTFTTSIVEPLVVRQDCNFRLTSGQVKHVTPNVTATATFGLNASGLPTTCPGLGSSYYCKVVWNGANGNSLSVIFPY